MVLLDWILMKACLIIFVSLFHHAELGHRRVQLLICRKA